MMTDSAPDYTTYTTDELRDVLAHIDREKYADRYAMAADQLHRRENADAESAAYQVSAWTGIIRAGALLGIVWCICILPFAVFTANSLAGLLVVPIAFVLLWRVVLLRRWACALTTILALLILVLAIRQGIDPSWRGYFPIIATAAIAVATLGGWKQLSPKL